MRDVESISLARACEILSISQATGRNWIRSGLLKPIENKTKIEFQSSEIYNLNENIKNNKIDRLNKRRNKKRVSGKFIPKTYLKDNRGVELVEEILETLEGAVSEKLKRIIIAEYSLKFFFYNRQQEKENTIYLLNTTDTSEVFSFVKDFLYDSKISDEDLTELIAENRIILNKNVFVLDEDILGLLYMSLNSTYNKKKKGAYYTPTKVVSDMVKKTECYIKPGDSIIDPCCGTGNFLIELIKGGHSYKDIHGCDIDEISIFIARMNIIIFSEAKEEDYNIIMKNIKKEDSIYLINKLDRYSLCIGNPPWGSEIDENTATFAGFLYETYTKRGLETFSLFIELGIKIIKDGGYLSYVVPETFFNVKTHSSIRKLVSSNSQMIDVRYWGNIFDGVLAPALSFITKKEKTNSFGFETCVTIENGEKHRIKKQREISDTMWNFNISDERLDLINKIGIHNENMFLEDNAEFALGIVTGNNKKFLKDSLVSNDMSPIVRGNDILKFKTKKATSFIKFEPDKFQQVAKNNLYFEEEKLLYRFISDTLVFAYDNKKTLSLNSANIVKPRLEEMPIKYILGILNSNIANYYFKLKFDSIKILRNHIEKIPLRNTSSSMKNNVIDVVNKLILEDDEKNIMYLYNELNNLMYEIYDLSHEEIGLVENFYTGNKFIF